MRPRLTSLIENALRRLPIIRDAYVRQDALQARLDALEASTARADQALDDIAAARVASLDPHRLEDLTPVTRTLEERVEMATRCRDADVLPKAPGAGEVVRRADGVAVQIMHNGIKVLAGGYYGDWMQTLITRCSGCHEPQEEVLFAEVLRHLGAEATMFELGGFWSFYSIWFLSQSPTRRSFVVEADPAHLEIGRVNAQLNECKPTFIQAFVGRQAMPPTPFRTETSGVLELQCVSVASMMQTYGIDRLDLLHCDAQGVEFDVLESCRELGAAGRLSWVVVSTHTHHISNDPLTHQRCLAVLQQAGATILAEHDVQESFSGDGLIVAKFGAIPADWRTPKLTYNRYSESLFRNPLYDLAALQAAPPQAGGRLFQRSGLLTLTEDGPLGRAGDTILLPRDQVMYPHVLVHGGWALETLEFLRQRLDPARRYVMLDIGANVGLVSREVSLRFSNVTHFICVEAEPGNFRALQYNLLALLGDRCSLWNVALSDLDGATPLFRDSDNLGNYSLNSDAMRARPFDTVTVKSVETGRWMRETVQPKADAALVWKSDTQGYDELIISRMPIEIWDRIEVAVLELWRIKKPAFDKDAFFRRIDAFPKKSIGLGNTNTTSDVIAYLDGDDWEHADLYLWR